VTGLPFSAAFRVVFAFQRTTAAFLPALLGGFWRLGGLPSGLVFDNDSGIVASRGGGQVRLVPEVASTLGQLAIRGVPLRPAFPQGKGFIERMIEYLQSSWLPLRTFTDLADMQAQADAWTRLSADSRHVRRLGGTVRDALGVELDQLRPLPARWPEVDTRLEARASSDGFVRVGDVDYSVPPRLAGRRLTVRASMTEVIVCCDGSEVARHPRSWARADVRLLPAHARELRLARDAAKGPDRVQRDVDAPARGEQRREERPGPHLRNLHRQVPGGRGDRLVRGAVALRRARVAALVRASADVRGRLGIDDGLQHPAEQPAHQLTAVGAAKHVDHLEQGRIV
jgi:hypothetical protein